MSSEHRDSYSGQTKIEPQHRWHIIADYTSEWELWHLPDGSLEYMSPSCECITGYTVEDFRADPTLYSRIIHPEDRLRVKAGHIAGGVQSKVEPIEFRIIKKDGQIGWVSHSCIEVFDPDGSSLGWRSSNRDITKQKKIENDLRIAMEKYEKIFASSPALHTVSTLREGRFIEINAATEKVLGYKRGELIGKTSIELGIWVSQQQRQEIAQRIMAKGRADDIEVQLRHKEGYVKTILGACEYLKICGGEYVLTAGVDITDRKAAERNLQHLCEELEFRVRQRTASLNASNVELNRRAHQLARLAGDLSATEQKERKRIARLLHDHLQQLMAAAKMNLSMLSSGLTDDYLKNIADNTHQLLSELLEAARSLSTELAPPVLTEGGLGDGLRWLQSWMLRKYNFNVQVSICNNCDPVGEDVKIMLFEIIRELLFNVVKHSGVNTARVELARLDGQLRIQVIDAGRGFDPEAVFQDSDPEGGLGLFSIRERLALLEGWMDVSSGPETGTRVTITMPVKFMHPRRRVRVRPKVTVAGKTHVGEKIKVLLVDDHTVIRQGLSYMLKREADIEVVGEAADGKEAVESAQKLNPDVILMDYSMPGMNGAEATKAIHQQLPQIRIIGLSMHDQADMAKAMKKAGAVDYLNKAAPSADLLASIRRGRS